MGTKWLTSRKKTNIYADSSHQVFKRGRQLLKSQTLLIPVFPNNYQKSWQAGARKVRRYGKKQAETGSIMLFKYRFVRILGDSKTTYSVCTPTIDLSLNCDFGGQEGKFSYFPLAALNERSNKRDLSTVLVQEMTSSKIPQLIWPQHHLSV